MRQPSDLLGRQVHDECQRNPLKRRRCVQQLAADVRLNDQIVVPLGMGSQIVSNSSQAANGRRVRHTSNSRGSRSVATPSRGLCGE